MHKRYDSQKYQLPPWEIFFRCSDKELQKSREKAMKLGKRHLITTFLEIDPWHNEALVNLRWKI